LALLYLATAGKLVQLQAFPAAERLRATAGKERSRPIPAMRGRILDRHGRTMADSLPRWRLILDLKPEERRYTRPDRKYSLEEMGNEMGLVAELAGISTGGLLGKLLDTNRCYSNIVEGLSQGAASRIQPLLNAARGTGLHLRRMEERVYPQGRSLAHVVGFTTEDEKDLSLIGACGLERMFDSELRKGKSGSLLSRSVARGYGVDLALESLPVQPAPDLRTFLDAKVGVLLREELENLQREHQPDWSCGVVINVEDSTILAIGALPDFDPNTPGDVPVSEDGQLIGHGFPGMWPFEPGSTMKPLVVSRALAEGAISPTQKFSQESGRWYVRGSKQPPIRNAQGVPSHSLNWREVLLHSSNIGAGKVGLALGADRLKTALLDWGLREPSGLPWRDQNVLFPPKVEWKKRPHWTIPAVSMGHQVQTTPLRLAAAYAALAGEGKLYSPRLFQNQEKGEGRQVLPGAIAREVRYALQDVVEAPHRAWLHDPEMEWGGKSGTVQKTHGDQKGQYTSLFVGFTPVENPEWVCVVVADNPKGKEHYGSKVAGPAVMNVLRRLSEGLAPTSSGPYLERSPFGGMLLSE